MILSEIGLNNPLEYNTGNFFPFRMPSDHMTLLGVSISLLHLLLTFSWRKMSESKRKSEGGDSDRKKKKYRSVRTPNPHIFIKI